MSDPSKRFSDLSIASSENRMTFEKRVAISRDILSSFDTKIFPSEFRSEICHNLAPETGDRPEDEWTLHGDLEGSLLRWSCFDSAAFQLAQRMQKPSSRDRAFIEKLVRRLDRPFKSYDALSNPEEGDIHLPLPVSELENRLATIVQGLNDCVEAAKVDGMISVERQVRTAKRLVDALIKVCERDEDLPVASPRVTGNEPAVRKTKISLFDTLIRSTRSGEPAFMVKFLENLSNETLVEVGSQILHIDHLLEQQAAPTYRGQFQALVVRVQMHAAQTGRKVTPPGRVELPRIGSKRSGGNASGARGKRRV